MCVCCVRFVCVVVVVYSISSLANGFCIGAYRVCVFVCGVWWCALVQVKAQKIPHPAKPFDFAII